MEDKKEYYQERLKVLEKRKRILKTDYFDKQIEECKLKLSKIKEDEVKTND